jgi:hypothetical protein
MGGSDDPSNLVELTIEEHAQAHLDLYNEHGWHQDLVAYRMLLGQVTKAEAIKELQKKPKSVAWKKKMSEQNTGEGNPFYGKKQSDKQKEAARVANSVSKPNLSKLYKKRFAEGNHSVPIMRGKNNPRARKIHADGKVYETIRECCNAYGFKNHNAIRYRLNHSKWTEWYYL